jgi:hypothetical protein
MPHAAAAFGSLPGRRADAGLPADLGAAGPQLMTERAILRLVFENRYWHENDHAQAGGSQSCRTDLEELGDAGTRQPLAPKRPAFPFHQSAPHPVGADIERVPQRKFQAIRAYRAVGADRDRVGGLVPRLCYVQGDGEPFVGIEARTGTLGLPIHPAGQFPSVESLGSHRAEDRAWQYSHWHPGRRNAPGYLEQCRQLTQARAGHPWLAAGSQTVHRLRVRRRRRSRHGSASRGAPISRAAAQAGVGAGRCCPGIPAPPLPLTGARPAGSRRSRRAGAVLPRWPGRSVPGRHAAA